MSESIHKCLRCGYTTTHLVTFKRHLARKNICKPKISNNDLKDEYKKYNILEKIHLNEITPNNSKITLFTLITPKIQKITLVNFVMVHLQEKII